MNVTTWGANSPDEVWPESNNLEIIFDNLLEAKKAAGNNYQEL